VVEGPEGKELDAQFFEDLAIQDSGHRRLFQAWFEAACEVRTFAGGAQNRPGTIVEWLRSHGLEEYTSHLESAGYDDLSLLADLQGAELAEMLDVAGVTKPGHRAKFRRATDDLRAMS